MLCFCWDCISGKSSPKVMALAGTASRGKVPQVGLAFAFGGAGVGNYSFHCLGCLDGV